MRLRRLPGALFLGLLASLTAHLVAYGGAHAEGGAFHALVDNLALGGGLFALVLILRCAFGAAGTCAQGSVLAAKLNECVPTFPMVALSGSLWFALLEALEPTHALASGSVMLAAMFAAAFVVWIVAAFVIRLIAEITLLIAALAYTPRRAHATRIIAATSVACGRIESPRLFARPPPALSLLATL